MGYADIKTIEIATAKTQILGWCSEMNLPALSWSERSIPMIMVNTLARILNKVSIIAASLKTMTVEIDATGDALEAWSVSVYGPTHKKIQSRAAIEKITLTCAVGYGPHTITEGSMVVTDGTYNYSCTTHASLPGVVYPLTITSGTPVVVPFVAQQPGETPGMVAPTNINRLVTTYLGISLSNQSLLSAGTNKESDAELHVRNHTSYATRNPLTLVRDSYIYWARTVEAVRRVQVVDNNPRGVFTVDVVIANTAGVVGSTEVEAVKDVLRNKILASFFSAVLVRAAVGLPISPIGKIYLKPGTDPALAETAIDEAFALLSLPIGGSTFDGVANQLTRAELEAAIYGATIGDERIVSYVELSFPAVSTTVAIDQAPYVTPVYSATDLKLIVLTE